MAIEFACLDKICLAYLDGNQNGFGHHHWMANQMDLITTIRWQLKPFWLPSYLITIVEWKLKRGEYDKPFFACFIRPQG
jgi:hypothetical protein